MRPINSIPVFLKYFSNACWSKPGILGKRIFAQRYYLRGKNKEPRTKSKESRQVEAGGKTGRGKIKESRREEARGKIKEPRHKEKRGKNKEACSFMRQASDLFIFIIRANCDEEGQIPQVETIEKRFTCLFIFPVPVFILFIGFETSSRLFSVRFR